MTVIARLTVRELVRRRIVLLLAVLAIVSVALVAFGVERLVTLAREQNGVSRPREPERERDGRPPIGDPVVRS